MISSHTYCAYDWLSMLGLKLNHVSKSGPWQIIICLQSDNCQAIQERRNSTLTHYAGLFRRYWDCRGGMICSDWASKWYFVKLFLAASIFPVYPKLCIYSMACSFFVMIWYDGRYYHVLQIRITLLPVYYITVPAPGKQLWRNWAI